jgi:hypothetical protein
LGTREIIQSDVNSFSRQVNFQATELISELLVKEEIITADQLKHARRVRSKLPGQRTLISVLQELRYVTAEKVAPSTARQS